jgi:myosin heavy subunit
MQGNSQTRANQYKVTDPETTEATTETTAEDLPVLERAAMIAQDTWQPIPILLKLQRANEQNQYSDPTSDQNYPLAVQALTQKIDHVGGIYTAGRDIHINIQSWDELAEGVKKLDARVEQAYVKQIISAERAAAIQTQLSTISAEMRKANRNRQTIMAGLSRAQNHVSTASTELAQQVKECTQQIERLDQQLEQLKIANVQLTPRSGQVDQVFDQLERQRKRHGALLTGLTGLVALAFDLGLTGGLVMVLPALMVVGQSALTLFTNNQTVVSCPACGASFS